MSYIQKTLSSAYDEVTMCATRSAEDFEQKAYEFADLYDVIVFSGGDGTFQHLLKGLQGKQVLLGYIPTGTVNDVARSLKIPRSVKGALKVILSGKSQKLDCMKINGDQYAMYVVAAGAFTSATYQTSQKVKHVLGRWAYAVRAVKNNLPFEVFPLRVECDGRAVQTHAVLALVMNGKSLAGFHVNRRADMGDGSLEVAVIKQVEKPNIFHRIGRFFSLVSLVVFGVGKAHKHIEYFNGNQIKVTAEPTLVWDFDGEEGSKGDIVIEALPQQVQLFVP